MTPRERRALLLATGGGAIARVSFTLLERKLGQEPLRLYLGLLRARGDDGLIVTTCEQLAARRDFGSRHQIERGLRRLEEIGLVVRTRVVRVYRAHQTHRRSLLERQVLGFIRGSELDIPKAAAEIIEAASRAGRGNHSSHTGGRCMGNKNSSKERRSDPATAQTRNGRRWNDFQMYRREASKKGVGVPLPVPELGEEEAHTLAIYREEVEARKTAKKARVKANSKSASENGKNADQKRQERMPLKISSSSSLISPKGEGAPERAQNFLLKRESRAEQVDLMPSTGIPSTEDLESEPDFSAGLFPNRSEPSRPPRSHFVENGGWLPGLPLDLPRPVWSRVPTPRPFPTELSDEECAEILARLYVNLFRARTGERCWSVSTKRDDLRRSKSWPQLLEAVDAMRAEQIAPAAWLAWSFDVWTSMGVSRAKRPPPLAWAVSTTRIGKHLGWYRGEGYENEAAIGGNRMVWGPASKELDTRWRTLTRRLDDLGGRALDEAAVHAEVDAAFPEGLKHARRRAQDEADANQRHIERAVAAGEWVWL